MIELPGTLARFITWLLGGTIYTPQHSPERTFTVEAETRGFVVEAETRIFEVTE